HEKFFAFHVAVVGATGAVGEQMLNTLEKREFPIGKLTLLSSKRSAGKKLVLSTTIAPRFAASGANCFDNTSAFRMTENVPLVVPEVNENDLKEHNGIIANPNCSTIQMVVALEPVRQQYGLKRVIVSTYQAVSGAGAAAIEELHEQSQAILNGEEVKANVLPVSGDKKHFQIAFNAIPQIE
ncbi:Asd/ArgC dimerization domain-containing protein, partial [Bacillus sp. D-CC]